MEEEIRNRLKEVEERKRILEEGKKEFSEGEKILVEEEKELRKEMEIEKKVEKEERRWRERFGNMPRDKLKEYAIYGVAVIVIFAVAIYLRTTMAKYWGFFEPDDFYHFSVIRAAVNNNFFIPVDLSISGWPQHAPISEPRGLYWVTLLPYFFLRFAGISYYTIMRYISVVYGLLDMVGAYLLARLLSKDKFFLLLVIVLVGLSSGDAARTSALIYRGDSFVTVFLIAALLFFVYIFKSRTRQNKVIFAVLSGISLSLANFVWNGAPFVTLVYIGTFLLVLVVSFVNRKEEMLNDLVYVLAALGIWFAFVSVYLLAGQIWRGSQVLTGPSFLIVYLVMIAAWYISREIAKRNYIGSKLGRLLFIVVASLAGVIIVYAVAPNLVLNIVVNNGLIDTTSFSVTIQELTPPTYSFLFSSFGYMLYSSPMSIIMMLPTVLLHGVPAISFLRTEMGLLFWLVLLLGFAPYLFMKVYDSRGFLGGTARWRLDVDVGLMALMAYFAITAFLQIYAIRFNSLVAVPLAIFGAYTIYWLTLFSKRFDLTKVAGAVAVFAITVVLIFSVLQSRFGSSAAVTAGAGVMALLLSLAVYQYSKTSHRYEIAGYAITAVLLVALLSFDLIASAGVAPADSMNTQMYSALSWLKNNSAPSSVVLTLWPDGSVVEGVANRTSIMDSVGSQNSQKSYMFARWLFNSSDNPQFLLNKSIDKPDYLMVRYIWLLGESVGIFQEAELNLSTESSYAFAPMTNFNEGGNATGTVLRFSNGAINVVMRVNANKSIIAYMDEGNGRISPFTYVAFADQNTGNFSVVRQTAFNTTNGQMLLIDYSDISNPHLIVNVTGAVIFASGLAQSNMVKLLYFCNTRSCEWNNNVASLDLVYANQDTRIYRILYNSTQ